MVSLQRTIKREMMFKGMNAKQKKLRRAERKKSRKGGLKHGYYVRSDRRL